MIFTIFFKLYECDNLDLLLVVAKLFLCFKNFVLRAGTKSSSNTVVSLLSGKIIVRDRLCNGYLCA